MASWARFAGEIWDHVFSPSATRKGVTKENGANLDSQLQNLSEVILPTLKLLPQDRVPDDMCLRQQAFIYIRVHALRLLLHRPALFNLDYDGHTGRTCGDLAVDIVQRVRSCGADATQPSSVRFDMTFALGGAVLVLATVLLRNPTTTGLQDRYQVYGEHFHGAMSLVEAFAAYLPIARRVADDLGDIGSIVYAVLNHLEPGSAWPTGLVPPNLQQRFPYRTVELDEHLIASAQSVEWPGMVSAGWDSQAKSTSSHHGVLWI